VTTPKQKRDAKTQPIQEAAPFFGDTLLDSEFDADEPTIEQREFIAWRFGHRTAPDA
jgi:hypothetical protein